MISITLVETKLVKNRPVMTRKIVFYHSLDKARKEIPVYVKEMRLAKKEKRTPKYLIDGVSYDTSSEKSMLMEMHAIVSVDNEDPN